MRAKNKRDSANLNLRISNLFHKRRKKKLRLVLAKPVVTETHYNILNKLL